MREILQMDRIMEKLTILSAAARYDVACTSSGVQRGGDGTHTGNAYASGICHAFTGDGRCISLLKILYTNDCIYDCKYCRNRCSNDVKRVSFTPEEICKLTMEFYRRNYIEGLFLSSGILHSPDYTMGLLYETLYLLRTKYHFNGYIHVKGIPGASADLLELTGYLADRMSVNLELPTADALRQIAPNKVRKNILSPMRQLQNGIRQSREFHGVSSMKSRMYLDEKTYYNQMAEMKESYARLQDYHDGIAAIREHKARQSAVQSWGEEIAAIKTYVEAGVMIVFLAILLWGMYSGSKDGTDIFQMADVNLLFTAPMKPQSVLMFRLSFQMVATVFASIYLVFQIPNLVVNMGLGASAVVAIFAGWILLLVFQRLMIVLTYTVCTTHEKLKPYVFPLIVGIVVLLGMIAGGTYLTNGQNLLEAAHMTFASHWLRYLQELWE